MHRLILLTLALAALLLLTCSNDKPTTPPLVNHAPQFTAVESQHVQSGDTLELTITAIDSDADSLALSCLNPPLNSTFVDSGDGRGVFTFTPADSQVATYEISFVASDGKLTDTLSITLTVFVTPNQAPILLPLEPESMNAGDTLSLLISASDPDGDSLALSILQPPDNSEFSDLGDGIGQFEFMPEVSQVGEFDLLFVVSDWSLADTLQLTISVALNGNHRPVIQVPDTLIAELGTLLTFSVTATDADGDLITLSMRYGPNFSEFSDLGNGNGRFEYIPQRDNFIRLPYNFWPYFDASDGELTTTERIVITVVDNINQAPVIQSVFADPWVVIGSCVDIEVTAQDPNLDSLSVSLVASPTLTSESTWREGDSWIFHICPQAGEEGTYEISFIVSDGELTDTAGISLVVATENLAPVFHVPDDQELDAEDTLELLILAADPNGTTPTLSADELPANATFEDHGDGSARFVFMPSRAQSGSYEFIFFASDSEFLDTLNLDVTVLALPNVAPTIRIDDPQPANAYVLQEDAHLRIKLIVTDRDGDDVDVTVSSESLIGFQDFDQNRYYDSLWHFVYHPSFEAAGEYSIQFTATDGEFSVSASVTIAVTDYNPPPSLSIAQGPECWVLVGRELAISISSSDPDGAVPTISASPLPENSQFSDFGDGTARLMFSPAETQVGLHEIVITASDDIQSVDDTLKINVYQEEAPQVDWPIPCKVGNTWIYKEGNGAKYEVAIVKVDSLDGDYWWTLSKPLGPLRDRFMIRGDSIFSVEGLEMLYFENSTVEFEAPRLFLNNCSGWMSGVRVGVPVRPCATYGYSCDDCQVCLVFTRSDADADACDLGYYVEERFVLAPGIGLGLLFGYQHMCLSDYECSLVLEEVLLK